MFQMVLSFLKITHFRILGTKLQLFFHMCKRTRDFYVILAEKNYWYTFCSCVYGFFFVPLRRNLCVNTKTLYELFRNHYKTIR